jgi:hypothetical protein
MMTYQDAVSDLVRLWDLLPLLVGPPWRELEPSLLDALERLAAAETDDDREQRAGQVLRLCLPHAPLRRALEPAVRRDDNRSGQAEPVSWTKTAGEVTAAIERSGRPGGDQWLVASLEDHVGGQPLRAGHGYDLTIGVAVDGPPADALAAEPVPPWAGTSPGADSTLLTVELRGDADIETVKSVLTLPRRGVSPDPARFRVTPRAGAERLTLSAVVMQGRMFIQVLTLTVRISGEDAAAEPDDASPAAVRGRASGRPLAEAFTSDRPDATLLMTDSDLWLTGSGPYTLRAKLPPSWQKLEEIAEGPRAALQEIAHGVLEAGSAAHQADVTIPPEIYEKYLAALERAGALMFRTLFFGPDATEELKDLGRALQDLVAHDGPLWLEVVAETPVIPWHLLAFPDPADPSAADPSHILGLRHRIIYPPMRRSTRRPPPSRSLRAGDGPLRVVLAVNRDIDEHAGARRDLVESQLAAWQQRADGAGGALAVTVPTEREVLDVLVRNMPPAELLYFFCHAYPDPNPGRLGGRAACLEFTGGHKVSLEELILREPIDHEFDAAPLVVLNACASAVPASSVYASFLPHLLGRGARGVIGTEADVPPVFAAAWAKEFFSRVLDGVPLADAAFELARDLVERYRNLLGLVYALHCDGRSLVQPAIPGDPPVPATET